MSDESDDESFVSADSSSSYLSADADGLCLGDILIKEFSSLPKNFNACHINAQSIPKHYNELLNTFSSGIVHAVLVSESWLKPTLSSHAYCLPGYVLVRNDRVGRAGGGVAIYLKSDIPFSVIAQSPSSSNAPAEYLFLEINLGVKVLLGVSYCPPSNNYFPSLEAVLENITPNYSHHLIMGDFNTDVLVPDSRTRKLRSIVDSVNLKILPLSATHHSSTTDTSIDLILTSDDSLIARHGQYLAPGFSKHDLIFCSYRLRIPKPKPVVLFQRNFTKLDAEKLRSDAAQIQWSDMQDLPDVNDKVEFLCTNIIKLFDTHAPVRPVKLKHRPTPWINDTIRKFMVRRDRAFRRYKMSRTDENWTACKVARNRCNQMCRNAKRRYIAEQLELSSPAGIWKFLRSLGVGKPPKQDEHIPFDLNNLNKHFASSSTVDTFTKTLTLNHIQNMPTPDIDTFNFAPATAEEIRKIILSLKSKAVGHDNIGRIMVVNLLDILLPAITHIINHSLTSGHFPDLWRKAYVIPLPKITNPSSLNHYRPISILPFLSKVLESIVHRQLTAFLSNGGLLNPYQSGFRAGHSTTTALLKVTEDIRSGMEKRMITVLVLIDFTNAFNAVDHDLLLAVLEKSKISLAAVSWFSSYLRGRQQAIRSCSVLSDWSDLSAGVPQGGILSPLLFSIFIDLVSSNLFCSYHLYADDLQLYSQVNPDDLVSAISHLNGDLNRILEWSNRFGIMTKLSLATSLLLPILDYADVCYLDVTEALLNNLERLQNTCIRFIFGLRNSLAHVTRVTAWVARFSANALNKQPRAGASYLTAAELIAAMEIIIKCEQRVAFETEYKQLSKKEPITSKSSIYKLNPYLDEKGIIRVGGRLNKSSLSPEMKNPAILPKKGRLTQLVIDQAHARTLHGGARLTLAHIRQKFWIISGSRTVKAQLRHCVRCHRFKPTENVQLMADLPQQRTSPSRPFTHTGMDFTGHVDVKLNKGRGVKTSKGYIVIFVCMATKAVHMELVSDLTTEAFLAAFQRFCHRRGTPKHCYSDCGTNFIGASKRLRTEFNEFKKELGPEFFTEIGKMEVEWHFNAPAWPTAGGVWEAAVKSAKYHLRRVLGDQKLTYEEFLTLLTQIEACLNSRPLCPLTEDPEEFYNYLTPGHFLTGSPTLSLPLSDYSDDRNMNLQRRWQLTEHMAQQFWKNWSTDYLHLLQTRCKWNKTTTNIEEGEIVLIKEDNLPPARWALGRVLRTHPGTDGRVRVTTLKTKNGIMKRPVTKLSPLPIETPSAESENKTEKNDQGQEQQIPIENSKTKPKTSSSKIGKAFVYLCTLLTLCSGTYSEETITSAQITSFESDRPVYYDTVGNVMIHDEWILLMYCNLSNYWDGMGRIKTYFTRLNDLCEKTDPRYCTTTLNQLQNEMELLDHYNSILLSPNYHLMKRKKRGLINGVGYVANSLFGVLDQRFADKYQEDIQTMQNNQNYLLQLIKNQTSIVELENTILKKSEKNIQKQFSIIDDYMKQTDENIAKIETQLEEVMASNYFNSASLAAFLLMNSLRRVQELLFDSVTSIYKGHMNAELLSPTELINQLHKISGRLPKSLSLPLENINDDIKDLYQLLYVKARITNNYFLFEIHIPLITDEDFILHRIIPIPIRTENGTGMVQLSSNYIAVDLKRNKFISLSSEDMQKCTQLKQGTYTCDKNLPVIYQY
ncbi:unnamed protein product [Plutella xylostella]|uniref:(diamondback moth) hypothetical protein n=1 Tax=Plutella xylostella TaxID=51655 RepID=A0A8S4EE16_PLUXY|nr:unnamed protein product [Plutella xylostella]